MLCHRHPGKTTRRKCYRCHKPICSSCQIRACHHLFCSHRCVLLHKGREGVYQGLNTLRSTLAIPPLPPKETPRWKASPIFLALLSVFLLFSLSTKTASPKGIAQPSPAEIFHLKPLFSHSEGQPQPSFPVQPEFSPSDSSPPRKAPGQVASLPRMGDYPPRPGWKREAPERWREAPDVSRGDLRRKEIALTFDGGGEANVAAEILATLRQKGISSTFFLTGEFIRSYPDLVRRMVEEGQEIANHTASHPHLTTFASNSRHELIPGVTRRYLWRELRETERLFQEITGSQMVPFWRAPYGEQNEVLRKWAREIGYQHISWTSDWRGRMSLDCLDWVADPKLKNYCSAEEVRDRILGYGERVNGGIVLMHLGTNRTQDRVHERLGEIIERLQERGYRLVKVSELLRDRRGGGS